DVYKSQLLAMAAAVTALRLAVAELLPPGRTAAAAESLLGVLLGAAVFAAAVLRARLLSAAELSALPRIGPKLLARLRKLRLLP
ncbi:polysaccharide biosynthesis protein, partial [Paenibacillus macerans]|nr:polysaccharide biosynthesis protein [Paenibacillus macerans]